MHQFYIAQNVRYKTKANIRRLYCYIPLLSVVETALNQDESSYITVQAHVGTYYFMLDIRKLYEQAATGHATIFVNYILIIY